MSARREPAVRIIEAMIAVPVSIAEASRHLISRGRGGRCRLSRAAAPTMETVPGAAPASGTAAAVVAPADTGALPDTAHLAIEGYDHLSARQILDRLNALAPDDLSAVADYERLHRRRQTVLQRIAQLS